MKPTQHAIDRALERHGVNGKKRGRSQKITKAVKEAIEKGVSCPNPATPWEVEVVHPDGRRWIVDTHTQRVITSLPPLNMNRKEKR